MPGTPHADTYPAPDSPATEEVDTEAGGGPGDGARPPRLDAPEDGRADDLKAIDGIGPKLEAALNAEGIYHFRQLAELTADQMAWLDKALNLRGRPARDDWPGQAKAQLGDG
jgi:NADH-quinone oxidoreductase subunit E